MDEEHLLHPAKGRRQMTDFLRRKGHTCPSYDRRRKKALELLQQAHKNGSSLDLPDFEISDVLREATEAAKK